MLPSAEGGSVTTTQPSAEPAQKLRSWLDLSHHPTLTQVIALKRQLIRNLPIELVNNILSFAEYWPHAITSSSISRIIRSKLPHPLPHPVSRPSAELLHARSETNTEPFPAVFHGEDNLLVQSTPLGLSKEPSQPWVSPSTQHPARMIVVEVTARRIIPAQQGLRSPNFLGPSHVWLEIGVVDGASQPSNPLSLSSSDMERVRRNALLDPSHREGMNDSVLRRCQAVYHVWLEQQRSRALGCLRVNVDVNSDLEVESRTTKSVYRFDDDEVTQSNSLNPYWSRILRAAHSPSRRKVFCEYVKSLDYADRGDDADFVRALRVGDEIGVWYRSKEIDHVTVIEGVRVTVFWEV